MKINEMTNWAHFWNFKSISIYSSKFIMTIWENTLTILKNSLQLISWTKKIKKKKFGGTCLKKKKKKNLATDSKSSTANYIEL